MKAEVTKQYGSTADQMTDGALSGNFQDNEKKNKQQNMRPEENYAEIMLKGARI